jgi:hypothetical protein
MFVQNQKGDQVLPEGNTGGNERTMLPVQRNFMLRLLRSMVGFERVFHRSQPDDFA